MNGKKTIEYIDKICAEKGLTYLDVRMYKGYEELFSYGKANGEKPTGKERLFLFSATKPMTVVCAMRLVEEGKLGLDDAVEKYLPAYKDIFLLDEKGNRVPTKNKMTVRHLLTMSGGLSYNVQTKAVQDMLRETDGKPSTEEAVSAFVKEPLLFEPGTRFEYSLCHDVLAAVIEKASGKRFSAYMDEIIFQPLGMTDSGFHTEDNGMYDMYDCDLEGKTWQIEPYNRLILGENYDSGGAGAISNVDDYVKFAVTLANGGVAKNGARILQEKTLETVRSTAHAEMQVENSFTCVQGDEYVYGLGVRVRQKDTSWGLAKGEYGWDGAAGMYLMVDPHQKIAVVIGMHLLCWPYLFRGEHLKIVQCLYEDMKKENLL
ncbi:MAG: beta-lactamase family protein [Clostridiales bacterium]|nr:beta-lactamase family protein [Clostridiales bacterium]